jgi:hypothetical protein
MVIAPERTRKQKRAPPIGGERPKKPEVEFYIPRDAAQQQWLSSRVHLPWEQGIRSQSHGLMRR